MKVRTVASSLSPSRRCPQFHLLMRSVSTGIQKFDSLSKFFDSVVDGTADLRIVNEEAKQEEFVPDEAELEIERQQEAQRMALAHGGFSSLVDFEEAIKAGHGADYHAKQGYPGMMGGGLPKGKEEKEAQEESAKSPKMAKTGDEGQAAFEAPSEEAGHPKTPAESPTPVPAPTSESEADTHIPQPERVQATKSAAAGSEDTARPKDEL